MFAADTPNHFASVAAYWSTATFGIQRPRVSVSLVPATFPVASEGKIEPFGPLTP